jgi:HNH endonuclease
MNSTEESHQIRITKRFWQKVLKTDTCWLWTGKITKDGYGQFTYWDGVKVRTVLAHRFAFGPVPDDVKVLHKCDNPPCCRDDHLFSGTQADNVRDCEQKGRRNQVRYFKLSAAARLEIIAKYGVGNVSQKTLAAEYGVSQPSIGHIIRTYGSRETV